MVRIGQSNVRGGVGVNEDQLALDSRLRSHSFSCRSIGGQTLENMETGVLYVHTLANPTSDWLDITPAAAGWRNGRLPFPATPCFKLVHLGTVPGHQLQVEVIGRDQFGMPQTETSPVINLPSSAGLPGGHRFWMNRVFSSIQKIRYRLPIPMGAPPTLSCGLFFLWNTAIAVTVDTGVAYSFMFPKNAGIGTRCRVLGIPGESGDELPEVESVICTIGTAGTTTSGSLVAASSARGGFVLGNRAYDQDGTADVATGQSYREWGQQDPNKLRIQQDAGTRIKAYSQGTDLIFSTAPGGGLGEVPGIALYDVVMRSRSPRTANQMRGPALGG